MAQTGSLSQAVIQPLARHPAEQEIVTILGGGGFLGRYIVRALTQRGYRVRIAVRKPGQAMPLLPFGDVGQVVAVQANMRDRESLAKVVAGSYAVINLTGLLIERGAQTFQSVHVDGAKALAEVVPAQARFIHVSAIGADEASPSAYARTKAAGEKAVLAARKDAVIIRPSVVFGPGDGIFNRLGAMASSMPFMPVLGADTLMQPVFAGDVAEVIARAVEGEVAGGRIYELGGPAKVSMRELSATVLRVIERKKRLVALPFGLASLAGRVVNLVDKLTFGLIIPRDFVFTADQVELLKKDNVVSETAIADGRTLKGLGIEPTAYDGIIPGYLDRFCKFGQFSKMRERRKLLRNNG